MRLAFESERRRSDTKALVGIERTFRFEARRLLDKQKPPFQVAFLLKW